MSPEESSHLIGSAFVYGLLLGQADADALARLLTARIDIVLTEPVPAGAGTPVLDVPLVQDIRPSACEHFRMRAARHGFLSDTAHAVLTFPGRAVESVVSMLLPDRVEFNGLVLFDQSPPGGRNLGDILVDNFWKREVQFVARYAFDSTDAEPDWDEFRRGHARVAIDSLNRALRERYHMPSLDLDTVVSAFRGGDVVESIFVPAVSIAYVLRFGIDRRFKIGDAVDVYVQIERPTRIVRARRHGGEREIGSLSFRFFGLPMKLMGTLQVRDGGWELGFVGLGTDLATVHRALESMDDQP